MKTRFCVATDVCQSDEFQSLPLESQLLYYDLCAAADSAGKVTSPRREARAYGLDSDPAWLSALYEHGYLLAVGGVTFVTHHWINNKYDGRIFRTSVETLPQYKSGHLGFAGEDGKSAYALRLNDDATTLERRRIEEKGIEENVIDRNVIESNSNEKELKHDERRSCICPECGATAYYTQDEAKNTTIYCDACGVVIDRPKSRR